MDFWFLEDIERLASERYAIEELECICDWLIGTRWKFDANLCVDAIIQTHGHRYEVSMSYPPIFPAAPPIVRPTNADERWSTHQYSDGTLCLEWRPDTWHPNATGADVLMSVHNLLEVENPFGSAPQRRVPVQHHLSIGQKFRNKLGRFYVDEKMMKYLGSLPRQCSGQLVFSLLTQNRSFLALARSIKLTVGETWESAIVPQAVASLKKEQAKGFVYKTALDADAIEHIATASELDQVIRRAGYETAFKSGGGDSPQLTSDVLGILLIDISNVPHFFLLLDSEDCKVWRFHTLYSGKLDKDRRTPEGLQQLRGKTVGIVGMGSAGGRIALSLVRTGISHFYLVDEDIFLPENICRHTLDWENVGEHKVDAVKGKLLRVSPEITVDISYVHLTGQESTAVLSGVLSKLGQCDVIVDATASPAVFNLLTATATVHCCPLVWLEIYAGGIGGMIARSRPGIDPDPQTMRVAYHTYTADKISPDLVATQDYSAEDPEGEVVSAGDADVGIISYHAVRLTIDTLMDKPSIFPYSMYLIGLANSWVFTAPFHTIPIATDQLIQESISETLPESLLSENLSFIGGLLKERDSADSSNNRT
jgi:sulfur-carrier protein adenylyltransferase/sulfurtransferase